MNFHINQIADDEYELLDDNNRRIGLWVQYPSEWVSVQIDGRPATIARDLGDAHLVSWSELRQLEKLRPVHTPKPWWKFW